MKLNKPIITIVIIIILVINLIFFSFTLISKTLVKKDNLLTIVEHFNTKKYLLNNKTIKDSIDNYKYPKEVFNYIDNINLNKIKNDIVNNIYNDNDILIDSKDISYLLKNSVYEYESITNEIASNYVFDDIDYFAIDSSNYINNIILQQFRTYIFFSNNIFTYMSIILSIFLFSIIIIIEKRNGYLISSITLLTTTIVLYYLDNNIYTIIPNIKKYIDKVENTNIVLDNKYMICFILGFVLLLIYIISFIKKQMREYRLNRWR